VSNNIFVKGEFCILKPKEKISRFLKIKHVESVIMAIAITKEELKEAVRESVREVLNEERMQLQALLLPEVSEKEQKNIERTYGKPLRKSAKTRKFDL